MTFTGVIVTVTVLLMTVVFSVKFLSFVQKKFYTYFEKVPDKSENKKFAEKSIKFQCAICFEKYDIKEGLIMCSSSENCDDNYNLPHTLCIGCLRQYAHSAIKDIPVAFGGIGLKCVDPECKNVFLLSSFESHIDEQDVTPVKHRLQQQCLLDAGIDDLVTKFEKFKHAAFLHKNVSPKILQPCKQFENRNSRCASCDLKFSVSTTLKYFICNCGRKQCRFCPRIYDEEHSNKSCEEMEENSENKLNLMISETVIRKCYKCGIAFMKEKGCNKMECRCGAKQCYICREKDIDYKHFCRCFDPLEKHGKCPKCNKTCRIYEDAEELDEINIQKLKENANSKLKNDNNFCVIT